MPVESGLLLQGLDRILAVVPLEDMRERVAVLSGGL